MARDSHPLLDHRLIANTVELCNFMEHASHDKLQIIE